MEGDKIEERAESQHDEKQNNKASECSKPGRTPAANSSDREHDGQCFHCLDERGKERGHHCSAKLSQSDGHKMPPPICIFVPVLCETARLESSSWRPVGVAPA